MNESSLKQWESIVTREFCHTTFTCKVVVDPSKQLIHVIHGTSVHWVTIKTLHTTVEDLFADHKESVMAQLSFNNDVADVLYYLDRTGFDASTSEYKL